MSVRAYVATAALQGLLACPNVNENRASLINKSVEYADALIKELQK